ncbi:MAG: hypothetical protein HY291_05690 [Planctomycetes bacterium]|nr:hypothetical protein [Planctomycetota bacterium]
MTYKGTVRNGVVVLEETVKLPDGETVKVLRAKKRGKSPRTARVRAQKNQPSLSAQLLKWAGTVKGLPADMSKNHDHYLYGTPKK